MLRLFPGVTTPGSLWQDLAPVSTLRKLKELQLVGYTPVKFTSGAATGAPLALQGSFSGCSSVHCLGCGCH